MRSLGIQSMSTSVMRMYNPLISMGVGGGGVHTKFPSGNFNLALTHARSSMSFRVRTRSERLCLTTRKSSPSEVERTSGDFRVAIGGVSASLSLFVECPYDCSSEQFAMWSSLSSDAS